GSSTGTGRFEAVREALKPGDEVLLPAAQEGRRELFDALTEAGVQVTRVAAYKSEPKAGGGEVPVSDAVIFGSPRTAEAFFEGNSGFAAKIVAIGPTTAKAIEALGRTVAAVAEKPTSAALVEAVVHALTIPSPQTGRG